jgi:uncharacterized protein
MHIPTEVLTEFCRRQGIRRLSLFGSILSDRFRPDSDIDLLVEFEPHRRIGFIELAGLEDELSTLLGRPVDLRTPQDLSEHFRAGVLASARPIYAGD